MALLANLRSPLIFPADTPFRWCSGHGQRRRVLVLITTETELDENASGVSKPIDGDIVFEHVSFGYSGEAQASAAGNGVEQPSSSPVLKDISFQRGRAKRSRSSARPARAKRR